MDGTHDHRWKDATMPVTFDQRPMVQGDPVWWPSMNGRRHGTVIAVVGTRIEVRTPSGERKVFVAGERYLLRHGRDA